MNDYTEELAQELLTSKEYFIDYLTPEKVGLVYQQYAQVNLLELMEGEGLEAVIEDFKDLHMKTGAICGILAGIIRTYEEAKRAR